MTVAEHDGAPVGRGLVTAWGRMGAAKRLVVVLAGLVVAVNVGLAGLRSVVGGGDPGGPTSSSFTTGVDGLAAWADLASSHGHQVVRSRSPLSASALSPRSTVVLAEPGELSAADVRQASRFVAAGGRLVVVGGAATPVLAVASSQPVRWAEAGVDRARGLLPVGEWAAVARVKASGRGRYVDFGRLLPVLGQDGRVVAVAGPAGRGWLVGLADAAVVQNGSLAAADNAAWALAATGGPGRPVVFVESVHGFGAATGLAALPASWRWAGLGAAVAVLALLWSYGQRFGPVERAHRRLRPPRRDYVDALAADLVRVHPSPDVAVEPLVHDTRLALAGWLGVSSAVEDASLQDHAARAGIDPADVQTLLRPARTDEQALATGRAAVRIRQITDRAPARRGAFP